MQSLTDISNEIIRQNWSSYQQTVLEYPEIFDLVWRDWMKKINFRRAEEMFIPYLEHFIMNKKYGHKSVVFQDENKMEIKNLTNKQRSNLHKLLDRVKLEHVSRTDDKTKQRIFCINKPTHQEWCWEFTKTKQPVRKKCRALAYCDNCECSSYDTELFISVYCDGIYCEPCLDEVSDGEGDPLSAHKFEPW